MREEKAKFQKGAAPESIWFPEHVDDGNKWFDLLKSEFEKMQQEIAADKAGLS